MRTALAERQQLAAEHAKVLNCFCHKDYSIEHFDPEETEESSVVFHAGASDFFASQPRLGSHFKIIIMEN